MCSFLFMLFFIESFTYRLTISAEITMMSMDRVMMVDTNGNIHSLTKFQVRKSYNIFHDSTWLSY